MPILSTAHYTAFGQVPHFYATIEYGIKTTLAGILKTPLITAMAVTEPYSSSTLKNAAKALAKSSWLPKCEAERFCSIVGNWSAHSALRNHIAHNRWQEGLREDSIRPVGLDIRSGAIKRIVTTDSRDWLATELFEEAGKLADLNDMLKKFQSDTGITEIIARKDEERRTEIEA